MADGKEHIIPFAVPIGDKGDPGKSAYEIAVEYGFKGSEAEWLDSLKYGKDGESAYQIAVDYGFQGTETEWLASLKGEKGEQGIPGARGAQGVAGAPGVNGVSVTHSWSGTTLTLTSASGTSSADLKGAKGDKGEKGAQGDKGDKGDIGARIISTVYVGTDYEGGNIYKQTFSDGTTSDFVAPKGAKGDKGEQGVQGQKGDPFQLAKVYMSVAEMNANYATDGVAIGAFVLIDTGNVEDEDNAKLYRKGERQYVYFTDLSGAQGIQGPQGVQGIAGTDGVSITEVKQIQTSNLDGGANVVRVTLSNGTQSQFQFKNGKKGSDGVDGKDYVLTETDKQEIASLVDIDTSKFVTTDTKQTIEGHKTFENAELKTATGSDTYLMNFTYQDMFDFNGGNDVGLFIKTEDGGYATFYKIPIVDGQTQTIATQEWVNENKSYVSNILSVTDAGHENVINFYPDGQIQIPYHGGVGFDSWYCFAEDEITDDGGGTIATREWVEANASGMKLDYLGDFAVETPSIDPNMYRGFMFQIGIDYGYGMAFDIVKSGMVFFEDLSWYGYGGGVYFPFTTSDLHRLGVFVDPYGNGANADEKIVLQLAPNMDWPAYEIASNPFIGATHENGQRVFVKIYGIKG